MRSRRVRAVLVLGIAVLLAGIGVGTAKASSAIEDERYAVPSGQTVSGNQYVHAREAVIDGTVDGDLLVAAERLVINGTVTGSVLAIAQEIVAAGEVKGSLRAVASTMNVSGAIAGDLTVASGNLAVPKSAAIAGVSWYVAPAAAVQAELDGRSRDFYQEWLNQPPAGERAYAAALSFLAFALLAVTVASAQSAAQSEDLYRRFGSQAVSNWLLGTAAFLFGIPAGIALFLIDVTRWIGLGAGLLLGLVLLLAVADAGYALARLTFWRNSPAPAQLTLTYVLGQAFLAVLLALPYLSLVALALWLVAVGARLRLCFDFIRYSRAVTG